jgi:hypothetical protein
MKFEDIPPKFRDEVLIVMKNEMVPKLKKVLDSDKAMYIQLDNGDFLVVAKFASQELKDFISKKQQ